MARPEASVGACNGNAHGKEVCSKSPYAQGMGGGYYMADTWSYSLCVEMILSDSVLKLTVF